jgi:hypothetical protein
MNAEGFGQWIDNELHTGVTTLTDDEVSQLGEKACSKVSKIMRSLTCFWAYIAKDVLRNQPKYNVFTNNCQRFAILLMAGVVDDPSFWLDSLATTTKDKQRAEYDRKGMWCE